MNEAILVFGDVQGHVNALLFSAATMALFDRPAQPAGSKQGADLDKAIIICLEEIVYIKNHFSTIRRTDANMYTDRQIDGIQILIFEVESLGI